jgi:hypothetical protein
MSIAASTTTRGANSPHPSLGLVRTSLQRQSSFGRCQRHPPWRGDKSTTSFAGFLNALRCSWPRAKHLDDASTRPSRLWHPLNKKESPRFIPNREGCQNATRPHRYTAVSATMPTCVSFLMCATTTRRMAPHAVITRSKEDGMIARRIGAPHPSLWVLTSLVRPSGGVDF